MFFTHFASTNQLPGFYKSETLPAPNMRNTERWLLTMGIGTKIELTTPILLEAWENIFFKIRIVLGA